MNVRDFYKGFTILSEKREERLVSIRWAVPSRHTVYTTHFYRHRDGSWHMDPDSLSYGIPFARVLKENVQDPEIARSIHVPLTESGSAPELDRIERVLKREEMYRKQLRMEKKQKEKEQSRVKVWFSESIRH